MKLSAQLGWVKHLPEGGSKVEALLSYEEATIKRIQETEATLTRLKAELKDRREEASRFVASQWSHEEIEAAKAACEPPEDPDADLIRMCRALGNGIGISVREIAILRGRGLVTMRKGDLVLTSMGVKMAERAP